MWLARKAISPSTVRQTTISACPEYMVRVGVTSSNWVVAIRASVLALEGPGLLQNGLDPADVEERLLRHLVELAVHESLEGFHGLGHGDVDALDPGENLGDEERLRQEPLDLARPRNGDTVLL